MDRYKPRNPQENEHTENREGKKNKRRNILARPDYLLRYDLGSLSPEPRIQSQRIFPDPSICRYSVPLGFSLEPVSLPVYPALFRPPNDLDPSVSPKFDKRKKTRRKREKRKKEHVDRFAIKESSETLQNSEPQNFASLPPAYRDPRSEKSADMDDSFNKRRFSDPGLGQPSSEDCSTSSTCSGSSGGSSDFEHGYHDLDSLFKKVDKLEKSNCQLSKELYETKLELESLKVFCESCGTGSTGLSPGKLADAISEIRDAAKMREEALVARILSMMEENSGKCKEVHRNLQEKLNSLGTEARLEKIETSLEEDEQSSFRTRLLHLEKEKSELKKELEQALSGRKKAEENTRRLERLVSILRKKINGVSSESCVYEEKAPSTSRSVSSVLERNPFIIANNNKTCLESDSFLNRKKIFFPKKEENGESSSTDEGDPSETSSLSAQVTITGPVTDL